MDETEDEAKEQAVSSPSTTISARASGNTPEKGIERPTGKRRNSTIKALKDARPAEEFERKGRQHVDDLWGQPISNLGNTRKGDKFFWRRRFFLARFLTVEEALAPPRGDRRAWSCRDPSC